ncbi:MAG TPA: DUF4112 domain-containing protein [Chthoniobacterales bacterium]|nr:DUF4112 domain-containing protein [Chthoniobacterales bacterium]
MPRNAFDDIKPPLEEPEFEVLPPERGGGKQAVEPLFRWIALLMDNLVRVPGTKVRFGIDPLIGLIPGLGDTGSAMVSALALIQAARHGLPKIVLARMSVNILLNELIGIVPVVGDAFSFWFKSNARNHELVKQHIAGARRASRGDWIFVFGVLVLLAVVVCIGIAVSLFVLQQLLTLVNGRR